MTIHAEDHKALSPRPSYSPSLIPGEDSTESTVSTAALSTNSSSDGSNGERPSSLQALSKDNSNLPLSSSSTSRWTWPRAQEPAESSSPRRDVQEAELGAFEGLKWGDYICFRMPTKDQVNGLTHQCTVQQQSGGGVTTVARAKETEMIAPEILKFRALE